MMPSMEITSHSFTAPDGVRLAADIGGAPHLPSVVLLHGGGQTRYSWRNTMQELVNRGYHVISLDARGHGESDWSPNGEYSLDILAADLRQVLGTLATKPVLVGASMGGITSMHALGQGGEPIAGALVLVDVVPRLDAAGTNTVINFLQGHKGGFADIEAAADVVSLYNPQRPRPRDISGLMKNLRKRDDGRLYWHWDPVFFEKTDVAQGDALADELHQACSRISVPVLLVRGMSSDLITDQAVEELRGYLPQLGVFEVAGAGHMITGDRNEVFNAGVLGFLETCTT